MATSDAVKAAATATDAATQASDAATVAQSAAGQAQDAAKQVEAHAQVVAQAAQDLAGSSSGAAKPSLSILTNAYAFNQAVQWLATTAANASDLASLQQYLKDLALSAQALVDSIDQGERATLARIAAGAPRVGTQQ